MTDKRYGIIIAALAILFVVAAACSSEVSDDGASELGDVSGNTRAGDDVDGIGTNDDGFSVEDSGVTDENFDASAPLAGQSGLTATGADGGGQDLQALLDRKIIQSVSLDVHVEDVSRNFQDIISIALTAGGFVSSSTFSTTDDQQIADLTIRVPAERYQDVLAQIRGMGDVSQESSNANDVSEEFTDLEARLRTLGATEQRYLELLAEADGINEILIVQDRLDSVRGQIEQVQGRVNLLNDLTDLATITIHLRPPLIVAEVSQPDEGGIVDPLEVASDAWATSLDTLVVLAAISLAIVAYSWWLVPPLVVLAFLARRWMAKQRRRAVETSP